MIDGTPSDAAEPRGTPEDMALAARRLGLLYVDLAQFEITPELLAQIPAEAALALGVFPCAFSETEVHVVLADPFDRSVLPRLSVVVRKRIVPCTAPETDVFEMIRRWYAE